VCRRPPETWPLFMVMSYQVLARKWRPQVFEDVVGQEAVTRTLQNAIVSGRIAHAFLFSGVRGVGKTTTARILAKALNCRQGPTTQPCCQCVSCLEIAAANCVDVLEIDAASNRGIDSIRELRASVQYGSARDRFKIFIIDEVHMLTNEAFNALLKTLEEPPAHVKFVLATTEHHKIPVTIVSRCQQFDFKPISFAAILDRLRLISREEGFQISDYGLRAVATAAQGSMRDAQSALDRVMAFAGGSISDDDVRALLGLVDERLIERVMEAVIASDRAALLAGLQDVAGRGVEAQQFCRKLIGHCRNLMVCKIAGWDERLLNLPDSEQETVLRQADRFSEIDLIRFYDLLNRTDNELRWHARPLVHLEMALLKLIELSRLPSLESVVAGLGSGQLSEAAGEPEPVGRISISSSAASPVRTVEGSESAPVGQTPVSPSAVSPEQAVSRLMAMIQAESMALYSSLRHASRLELRDGKLLVGFPASEHFHAGIVEQSDSAARLLRVCEKITGLPATLEVSAEAASVSEASRDPVDEPKVQSFIKRFPGRTIVERKAED
jgi:DNA polymerase III subunit gamma/tau